ncbi:EAL domain, c-di-GMP-specific phosphodiesterase class I (or its enzymatically inactive variant) [Pseudomonas helmanticensis]|uniref:EAL domain, c-di-GMP-specific phosphodiesterase class I (Or its enzymatically inactive variant) n=1 Tax=Pseudomonas helmanticensis TaxID=1471381 RepID=A0ACD2U464_9PSED|nr:EAL domain-containing response regulator [Pseudomonas helmanticensis]SMQ25024.1 EAL domain, c-di-GMP-specific phosphodiesterase class I (or its enzymatically inactive variant) [Pseudomonas helmanticensis]
MASPRILVLENHDFARNVLVRMLHQLCVHDVLQAADAEQAMVQIHLQGGVDIVMCDLTDRGIDCLEFLRLASHSGMVRAVMLCSELAPEMSRTLGQMASLAGLQLLGVLSRPIQLRDLSRLLQRYSRARSVPKMMPVNKELPSEDEVRRGLALGEFRAWFQPQFQLHSGRVSGVEALARWEHPARGTLLPCDFLAAVLAYDLTDQMFKHLLEQGLNLLGILRHRGVILELSFNLHASQLNDNALVEHIKQALERHGFKGSVLMFEVAENGLLDCPTGTQENLLRLRLLGCGLAVDDFGVGFSSLKLLCQLPFTQIKLDGRFVQHLDRQRNRAMVASTRVLARSLGMDLVIEGVSGPKVLERLLALECEIGQGYYLARPMNGHDLLKWLEQPADSR